VRPTLHEVAIEECQKVRETNGWEQSHAQEVICPSDDAAPLVRLVNAWEEYARSHAKRYGGPIGEDGRGAPLWAEIGKSPPDFLDYRHGNLDGGATDTAIRRVLELHGIDPDE
jgi:hypothetical protein